MADKEPAVQVPENWEKNVIKNTTIKYHGEILGLIKSKYGTTWYGPLPRECGICGRLATHRNENATYVCNKHKVSSTGPYHKLKHPGSVELGKPGSGRGRQEECDFVEIWE